MKQDAQSLSQKSRCSPGPRWISYLLALFLSPCLAAQAPGITQFDPGSSECKTLLDTLNSPDLPNVGFGTLTITHPDIVNTFKISKVLGKLSQVHSTNDQADVVRRIIRSYLSTRVLGSEQPQPLRPAVIPELLCPLLSASQNSGLGFCGPQFNNNQALAIAGAQEFLDAGEPFENFSIINNLFQPLALVVRPPRLDLAPNQQLNEINIVYGLRDPSGQVRKPATLMFEFAAPKKAVFYENIANLFFFYKDLNDKTSRETWALNLEKNIDCNSPGICNTSSGWQINQIRLNEFAFRGTDLTWNLREFNFPSMNSLARDVMQVPVAYTPFVDFSARDTDPDLMAPAFELFLQGKGLSSASLTRDQLVEFFEVFMAANPVLISNTQSLKSFVVNNLSNYQNPSSAAGNLAFPFHLNPLVAAPSAHARPGMKLFEGDQNWSKSLKETCQGCHVVTSSAARVEGIVSTQGFYHISPRIKPFGPELGPSLAGGNILSNFLLRETRLRFRSFMRVIGCNPPIP